MNDTKFHMEMAKWLLVSCLFLSKTALGFKMISNCAIGKFLSNVLIMPIKVANGVDLQKQSTGANGLVVVKVVAVVATVMLKTNY